MCLIVSIEHHPDLKPKTAKTDLRVYKILTQVSGCWFTPYQSVRLKFNLQNKIRYKSTIDAPLSHSSGLSYCARISRGIHSFYSYVFAINEKRWCGPGTVFYAVIPKGSKYYIGVEGDIVSSQLIIFRNKETFEKYSSKHKVDMYRYLTIKNKKQHNG